MRIECLTYRPRISIVVPLYNKCIQSVTGQFYPNWELCPVDDASSQAHVASACNEYVAHDCRIRFMRRDTNGHIAAATNSAIGIATGEFVAFLDHDDELAPQALYIVAEALNENADLDLIFTDEDKINEEGERSDPWFKPDWNYDLMLSQNCVVHLAVYRRSVFSEIGGLREGYDGSQDYDLTLRFIERTTPERIHHIPMILYHWRKTPGSVALDEGEKAYAYAAALRAVQDHLDRTGTGARATTKPHLGDYRTHWPLPEKPPHVAIVVPTKDRADLLQVAVESIRRRTTYPNYTIHIIDNGSIEQKTQAYLPTCTTPASPATL